LALISTALSLPPTPLELMPRSSSSLASAWAGIVADMMPMGLLRAMSNLMVWACCSRRRDHLSGPSIGHQMIGLVDEDGLQALAPIQFGHHG